MRKKLLVLLIVLTVMISICACHQQGDSEETPSETNTTEATDNNTGKVIGGGGVVEKSEYVSLGGILEGADPEDVEQLQDSLDIEEIQAMNDEEKENLVGNLDEISEEHSQIVNDVQEALDESGISVDMNQTTGKITMDETILFDKNEYKLSKEGKEYLDSFFETYATAILDSSAEECVSSIQIIGHTDTSGDYDYNKELSEKRAEAVKDYCLSIKSLKEEQVNRLSGMLKTIGKSYDEPIYDGDKVDMAASRRVEFKIIMNVD